MAYMAYMVDMTYTGCIFYMPHIVYMFEITYPAYISVLIDMDGLHDQSGR